MKEEEIGLNMQRNTDVQTHTDGCSSDKLKAQLEEKGIS